MRRVRKHPLPPGETRLDMGAGEQQTANGFTAWGQGEGVAIESVAGIVQPICVQRALPKTSGTEIQLQSSCA
jgi:hypothetical protein